MHNLSSTCSKNNLTLLNNNIDQKILEDYWNFFTTEKGADILPYVYLESSSYYNNLIKNCPDYYLCKNETKLISESKTAFTKHLSNVTNIIEIGPGSAHAVLNKSLPIISSAKNLKLYQGIDYSENYLEEACNIINSHDHNLKVEAIEADLLNLNIQLNSDINTKKALMFLGGTLGNFNKTQRERILRDFSNLINKEDLLILTVDTNQDQESLLKAYDNKLLHDLVRNALKYYSEINPEFKKYIDLFEIIIELDSANNINMSYLVKESFSFNFTPSERINLAKGQKLRGINSHKLNIEEISRLLSNNSFDIEEILSDHSNKVRILICRKH